MAVTAAVVTPPARTPLARVIAAVLVGLATALLILGAVVLLLISPLYMHPALERSGAAQSLGLADVATAYVLSDRTVGELFLGPGRFDWTWETPCSGLGGSCAAPVAQPFYDAAEASHLRDARTVLYGFLAVVALGLLVLVVGLVTVRREPWFWRAVSRGAGGLALVLGAIGIFSAVAFDQAFTLFHEVFFPGGNWSFDRRIEHMVQLYPTPFWEMTATVLVLSVVALGGGAWWLARQRARRVEGWR